MLSVAIVPTILLSPLDGIVADRVNRRNIMVVLDALTGLSVLGAALILSSGNAIIIIIIIIICVLLVLLSVFGAFEIPTVQACIPSMLIGDNITKGNAVVNQIVSLAYLIAPIEDDDIQGNEYKTESGSITTQRALLHDYIK